MRTLSSPSLVGSPLAVVNKGPAAGHPPGRRQTVHLGLNNQMGEHTSVSFFFHFQLPLPYRAEKTESDGCCGYGELTELCAVMYSHGG